MYINNKWFTLVEFVITLVIWAFIIYSVTYFITNLYNSVWVVDDGISVMQSKTNMKEDIKKIYNDFPKILYMTWNIQLNDNYGFNMIILEDQNSQTWMVIWVTDWYKLITWYPSIFDDYKVFYKILSPIEKDMLKNWSTILEAKNIETFEWIYPIKFSIFPINNMIKIDIVTAWYYNYKNFWKNFRDVYIDKNNLWYNLSFLIP